MLKKNVRRGDGAKILIGQDISVELVRAKEGKVVLLIDVPRGIPVVAVDQEAPDPNPS
ncbi:MAG: carbon storage regulator [Proteobacteria bacterium]|nr:carbon storage regulator [Pseudomonadota bacterium]